MYQSMTSERFEKEIRDYATVYKKDHTEYEKEVKAMLESYYAQFSSETSNSEDSGDIIEVSDAVIDSSKKNETDNAQRPGISARSNETEAASNNSTISLLTTMAAFAAMPQKNSPTSSKSSSSSSRPKNAQRTRTSKHKKYDHSLPTPPIEEDDRKPAAKGETLGERTLRIYKAGKSRSQEKQAFVPPEQVVDRMIRTRESYPKPGGHEYEEYMRAVNYGFDARQGYVQQNGETASAKPSLRQRIAAAKGNTSDGTITSSNKNSTLSPPDKSNDKAQPKSGQATPGFCATVTEFFSPSGPKRDQDKASPDSEEYVAEKSTDDARRPPQSHYQALLQDQAN